jgi:penicillin amidase
MSVMKRLARRALLGFVLLLVLMAGGGYVYLRRSLPHHHGSVEVAGITAPVEIVRDAHAIPHIFASTRLDALYGLGYAHAQDRLWQMEFQRRISHGRLSEIFGAVTIPEDRFLRTVGFGRAARSAWNRLSKDAQTDINAYVSGVNAFIDAHKGSRLPPEFSLLRFEPEPWSGVDVIGWGKMMAWDLSANYDLELLRHDIAAKVGLDRLRELMPPYPDNGPTIVRETQPGSAPAGAHGHDASELTPRPNSSVQTSPSPRGWLQSVAGSLSTPIGRSLLGGLSEGTGSNNWVVDGTLTASGKPLLANDPHLAPHIPSLWYLAHLKAGDFDVSGATLPGAPAVIIGRNRSIAWGVTNVAADVQDLYRERLDREGRSAEFRGAWEPLRIVTETIRVSGEEPILVNVRTSRHGPLVSDAINANNEAITDGLKPPPLEPLAFRWTALDEDDSTVQAFLNLNAARNWTEFTASLEHFVVPSQNFVYADVDGHIGYYAPGRIPVRASGDGAMPVAGWTGDAEWTSWVPFEQLPHAYDPPDHFIVTANHKPAPQSYPFHIALEYPEPYRALRITELLKQGGKLTPDYFRRIQADTLSAHARELLPLLLRHAQTQDASEREAIELLKAWNFDLDANSTAAAIFEGWFLHLAPALAGDELGALVTDGYKERFSMVTRFIASTLSAPNSAWCDNITTDERESCGQIVTGALHDGVEALKHQLGSNIASWRWDAAHTAVFPHQGLDSVPVLGWLLNRRVPNGGDFATVNAAPVNPDRLFEQNEVPGYRQILDLSSSNDNRFLDATGQSGHFLSKYYDDALEDWQAVQHRPMLFEREAIEKDAIGTLRLVPKVK